MVANAMYGTGVYGARTPKLNIRTPDINSSGAVRYASDLFASPASRAEQRSSSTLISNTNEEDSNILGGIKPSTMIRGGKKLYDAAAATMVSDLLPGLGVSTALSGLDVGTAVSGLDVGTSAITSGSDFFGLAESFGWGEAGSSVAASAGDAGSSMFLADIGGFEVPWLAGVDNLFAGDVTGAAEDTIGATVGYALGGPVGGFIGAQVAEPVFEFVSDVVEDVGDALGSVICTHLHATGNLSADLYAADAAYGKRLLLTDPAVYYGYRRWADTVVHWMKSSKIILHAVKLIAMPIIIAMAANESKSVKSSYIGKVFLTVGISMCRYLGKNLPETLIAKCGV